MTEIKHQPKSKSSSSVGGLTLSSLMPQAASASPSEQQGSNKSTSRNTKKDKDTYTISNDKEKSGFNDKEKSGFNDKEKSGFTIKISLGGNTSGAEDNMQDNGMDVETIVFPIDKKSQSRQKMHNKKEGEHETLEGDSSIGKRTSNATPTNTDASLKDDDAAFENTTSLVSKKQDTSTGYSTVLPSANLNATDKDGGEEDGSSNNIIGSNTAKLSLTSKTSRSSSGIVNTTTTSSSGSTASFLDSLSEDQRRVRTRHLPGATGFRKLHKSEIKRDMALCKAMLLQARGKMAGRARSGSISAASGGGTKEDSSKAKDASKTGGDNMDIDGEGSSTLGGGGLDGNPPPSDEESAPSTQAVLSIPIGGKTNSKSSNKSTTDNSIKPLPTAFTLPHLVTPSLCVDLDDKTILSVSPNSIASSGCNTTTKLQSTEEGDGQQFRVFSSPQVVESKTAFNPPRPPESVGPKKLHRLCRWERNPHAVEIDMNTYRKTVERTRQELRKTEVERERIELVGCHLRNHFLNQYSATREEMDTLNDMYAETQIECVKAAELLTSKTRSKGGVHAMRDVISVLKSRGMKSDNGNDTIVPMEVDGDKDAGIRPWYGSGVGGICSKPNNTSLASGWLLPGNDVSSPYGRGSVISVFGPTQLDVGAPSVVDVVINRTREKTDIKDTHHGFGVLNTDSTPNSLQAEIEKTTLSKEGAQRRCMSQHNLTIILPPRICVRLPFGIGYFSPNSLNIMEDSASYSDVQLGNRWLAMLETAQVMGTSLDANTMENHREKQEVARLSNQTLETKGDISDENLDPSPTGNVSMNAGDEYDNRTLGVDRLSKGVGPGGGTGMNSSDMDTPGRRAYNVNSENATSISKARLDCLKTNSNKENTDEAEGKLLRFGCGILPTPSYPGGAMDQLSLDQLEKNVEVLINRRGGIVGKSTNPCVPPVYKQWERQRQESRTLEGKVLQLRNEVHRQSQFRRLNERSCQTGKDRRDRYEVLLVEMKADLNSLKERLNEELVELGIDDEKAEELLIDHNKQAQEQDTKDEDFKYDIHHDALPKRRKEQCHGKVSRPKLESVY